MRKAAEQGYALAQYSLGWMYANGQGVPKDNKEAVKWYRLSAEQGDDVAQFCLGVMYQFGEGVPKDYIQAYAWFNLAASNGHENAKEGRGITERKMTPEQIAKAQELSKQMLKEIEARKNN